MPNNKTRKPIEIKIATVVAVSAILNETDLAILDTALKQMTGGMTDFFDNEFTVIDIAALGTESHQIDWPALVSLLKTYQLNAVAVRNAPEEIHQTIVTHGLSIDTVTAARAEPVPSDDPLPLVAPAPAPIPVPPTSPRAMIVDTPVRAGQRIYARGTDLIITAMVNNGAEIIADGSIHVYAPLRGRALAGASGDTQARIFAVNMEPELVSIAGVYRTFENGFTSEVKGQAAQIRLVGDRIDVISLNSSSRP
ncbi:septum site-determining protein MinC [Glaciimonas sp. GG7]